MRKRIPNWFFLCVCFHLRLDFYMGYLTRCIVCYGSYEMSLSTNVGTDRVDAVKYCRSAISCLHSGRVCDSIIPWLLHGKCYCLTFWSELRLFAYFAHGEHSTMGHMHGISYCFQGQPNQLITHMPATPSFYLPHLFFCLPSKYQRTIEWNQYHNWILNWHRKYLFFNGTKIE